MKGNALTRGRNVPANSSPFYRLKEGVDERQDAERGFCRCAKRKNKLFSLVVPDRRTL